MSYLMEHDKRAEKVKKGLGNQPVEFIELIRTQEVNEGSPRIEDDYPAKKMLQEFQESLIFNLCKCRKMSQPQCHYTKYFVAIKTKMHVEDSLDSNKIFDFW